MAIDFSDRTVFAIENIKIPDYCSLLKLGLSKTKTQFGNVVLYWVYKKRKR